MGKTTTYNYDSVTKLLKYIQNANNVRTAYTYDNRDRTSKIYLDSDKDGIPDTAEPQVAYLYANNRLSGIDTATTDYTLTYDIWGNVLSIKAGNYTLATYEYAANNGKLKKLTYGNGDYEEYVYDELERLVQTKLNGVIEYTVKYDANGRLYSLTENDSTHIYEYDSLDRLVRAWQEDENGETTISVENFYDSLGRPTGSAYGDVSATTQQYGISYKANSNLIDNYTMPSNKVNTYSYDELERLSQKTHSSNVFTTQYSYVTDANGNTSSLISRMDIDSNSIDTYFTYTYDNLGNIVSVCQNGTVIESYEYDSLGQMTRANSLADNSSTFYQYDKSGNILYKFRFAYTTEATSNMPLAAADEIVAYQYTYSGWGDLLSRYGYNGSLISYDEIGNPTNWRNALSLNWNARELQSVTLSDTKSLEFEYDSSGIRTKKTYVETNGNTFQHSYILDGSKIIKETVKAFPTSAPAAGTTFFLLYYYDESGVASVNYNGARYYYVKNLQGDVIGLVNASGQYVVQYIYDAWGRVVSATGSLASTLGQYNPFRYRGYYYDRETGFYYLQGRYYDPTVGRFLNADGIIGANGGIEGYNMFAYCNNNPVMYADPSGCMLIPSIKGIIDAITKIINQILERFYLYTGFLSQFMSHGVPAQDALKMATDVANHRLEGNNDTVLYAYETGGPDYNEYGPGDSVKIAYNATIFVIEGNTITRTYAASTLPQFTVSKEYGDKGGVATLSNGKYSYKFYEQYAHKTNVYHVRNYGTSDGSVPCVRWDKGSGRFIDSTATGILIHNGYINSYYDNPASMGCIIVQGSWSDFYSYVGTSSGTLFIYGPNRYIIRK